MAVSFEPEDGGTRIAVELDYRLAPTGALRSGPLGRLTDVLFIRRALRDMLRRTVERFAVEAEDEAGLR